MIQPLPADTVFEAKERTRKKTRLLFILLAGIYILFFNLAVLAIASFFFDWEANLLSSSVGNGFKPFPALFMKASGWITAAAILAACIHFWIARSMPLDRILKQLGAKEADRADDFHLRFTNIVREAEAASGIRPIRAVVIPGRGSNAFSAADAKNQSAIGVTEGLLACLDRSELSAVVAHEAAHLTHEDSKLKATACSLFGVFNQFSSLVSGFESEDAPRRSSAAVRVSGRNALAWFVLWLVLTAGRFLTKLIYMAISRTSEYSADADAVHMCQDPLSLAQALDKISRGYRGGGLNIPEGFSALFLMNPQYSRLDENESLFSNLVSTHPPAKKRIQKLLAWAKADLSALEETRKTALPPELKKPAGGLFLRSEGAWLGPISQEEAASLENLKPSTWVAFPEKKDGAEADAFRLIQAGEDPALRARFEKMLAGTISPYRCPRCGAAMLKSIYHYDTKAVVDRCRGEECGMLWCDGGEVEAIQMLLESIGKGGFAH